MIQASVVIPVRNGARLLETQLKALAEQTPTGTFEVIVSDNGSTDDTVPVALAWAEQFARFSVVDSSERPGVSHARNTGAREARTPLVLFADADDAADPGWVAAMVAGLGEHDVVGGLIETAQLNSTAVRSWTDETAQTELPVALRYLPYGVGANLGVRKAVWEALDGFDTSYVGGHEEVDFCWRAQRAGYTIGFVPEAVMHYRLRGDVGAVMKQRFGYGRSNAALQGRFRTEASMPPFTRRRALRVLLSHLRGVGDLLGPRRGAWLTGLAWASGRLAGVVRYFGDETRAPQAVVQTELAAGNVTIAVISYNHAAYLEQCLRSALSQTVDVSIVHIDDASTDDTAAVARRVAAAATAPVQLIEHEANRGLGPSLVEALAACQTEFFAYIAGDDWMEPERVEAQLAALAPRPDAALCYSDAHRALADGVKLPVLFSQMHKVYWRPDADDVFAELLRVNWIPAPSMMMRTAALRSVGGYDPSLFYEDHDVCLRLARRFGVVHVDRPLVTHRELDGSLGQMFLAPQHRPAWLRARAEILAKHLDHPEHGRDVAGLVFRDAVQAYLLGSDPHWFVRMVSRVRKVAPLAPVGRAYLAAARLGVPGRAIGRLRRLVRRPLAGGR